MVRMEKNEISTQAAYSPIVFNLELPALPQPLELILISTSGVG